MEWLAIWGVASATASVFKPILEKLATKVADDIAKSYVKSCFSSVFSAFHQKPLAKATGLAVKELLDLIENELLDADLSREQITAWTDDVQKFLDHEDVATAIGSLFLDPDYKLDPAVFARAWQQIGARDTLPEDFSWQRIAKRFPRAVQKIRSSTGELKETFLSLSKAEDSSALKELQGLPPDFDLEKYREALVERYGNLDFASLDMTGAYYSDVRLWSVFVPQSVRECHEYDPQLLEVPKEHLERLAAAGELDAQQLAESEKLQDERRQAYVNQPARPVLEVVGEPTALAAGIAEATSPGTDPTLARSAHMQRLVILGDPGSGKSSLLRYLALRWARIDDANLRYTQPLPLLIELRDYNRWECTSGKDFPKYLNDAQTWHRLNQQTLRHLLEQPERVVLLLDGLDEVFDPAERERVVNDIHRFSNDYKHVRIVVTSRVVGYQPHRLRSAEFRHFMLQDLDEDQIGRFLDKWHEVTFDKPEEAAPKRDRLDHAIKNSKSIAQLAGNPLLLTMMAILNRNQKLPDDRVDLYQQCSRLLLHQWDVERTLGEFPGLSAEIGLREKTDILRTIAYAMQTGIKSQSSRPSGSDSVSGMALATGSDHDGTTEPAASALPLTEDEGSDRVAGVERSEPPAAPILKSHISESKSPGGSLRSTPATQDEDSVSETTSKSANYIDRQTLESLIEDYLHTELRFEQARAVARALVEQLRARNFILCYLGADSYAFVHRTFLEYFCAADIVHQFNVAKTLSEQDLIGLFDAYCRDDDWREVLRLICGQIDEQCAGRIVEHLATRTDLERWDGLELLPELPLAIHCLTEVRNAGKLQREGARLLDQVISVFARVPGTVGYWEEGAIAMRDFLDELCGAAEDIGMGWPGASNFSVRSASIVSAFDGCGANSWGAFASALLSDRTEVLTLATSEYWPIRQDACRTLCKRWPDDETRVLVKSAARNDASRYARATALRVLSETWPDEDTRAFLGERATHDVSEFTRSEALKLLGKTRPHPGVRQLLAERATSDDHSRPRRTALQVLTTVWPKAITRRLLNTRAVSDPHAVPRRTAIALLAETWPDENTRNLLGERSVQDEHYDPRAMGLRMLAEQWPDENTRELLAQRAVQDESASPRSAALQALAKKWPDETTRELLAQRAVQDDNEYPRHAALQALAANWPDETTLELLEAQVGLFEEDWNRSEIEETTKSLREKLTGGQPRTGT